MKTYGKYRIIQQKQQDERCSGRTKKSFDKTIGRLKIPEQSKNKFVFHRLFDFLSTDRNYVYSAASDPEELPTWLNEFRKTAGFVLKLGRLQKRGEITKQEGVDVKLAIDATRLAYTKTMRTCILFGADGDFIPLVESLSDAGCIVVVVSFSNPDIGNVAPRLQAESDRYIRVNNPWIYYTARDNLRGVTQRMNNFHQYLDAEIFEQTTVHGSELDVKLIGQEYYAMVGEVAPSNLYSCVEKNDLITWIALTCKSSTN